MLQMNNLNSISDAPVCFWSWNGDITEEEIKKQLSEFADNRLGGVIVHARAGLKTPYMGDEWFERFELSIQEAKRLGLEVWIYDEDGWPSGFAGGRVPALGDEYCLKRLRYCFGAKNVPDGLPTEQYVALFRPCDDGTYEQTTAECINTDTLIFYYTLDRHYVDLLHPDTVRHFIGFVHERYAQRIGQYFGSTVKGVFTDEPQLNNCGYPWSTVLEQAFEKNTGKALKPLLWMTAVDNENSGTFRYELWNTIFELYNSSFVKQLADWCGQHQLILTGHYPCEDGLTDQIAGSGSVMRYYADMQLPGIDHLGSRVASPVLMKQPASIARQFGNGHVLSETFGGSGWGVSFAQLAWIWGGQSVLGITKPCYHLSAFSIEGRRKRDYPAFFSYQEPWWDEFHYFNRWIQNLNSLMTEGERLVHTLVVPPMSGVMYHYHDVYGDRCVINDLSCQFRLLLENLLDIQLDFDLGEEMLVSHCASLENGKLRIGGALYDTVFVSDTDVITEPLQELLLQFAREGGRLFFVNRCPDRLVHGGSCSFEEVKHYVVCNRRDTLEKWAEHLGGMRDITVCRRHDLKPVRGVRTHLRRVGEQMRLHIWPDENFASQRVVICTLPNRDFYLMDLISGERKKLQGYQDRFHSYVDLTIKEKENCVLDIVPAGKEDTPIYQLLKTETIMEPEITACECNSLTIDTASYALNGEAFTEPKPVIRILDEIYEQERKKPVSLLIRYSFWCKDGVDRTGMLLAVEDLHCQSISINGKALKNARMGWWIDHSIGQYLIEDAVVYGENTVTLEYILPPVRNPGNLLAIFETEINRFYYPIEPENIYIRGRFDVLPKGRCYERGFCFQTDAKDFVLVPAVEKHYGDLSHQGMCFYRGSAEYAFWLEKPGQDERILVSVEDYHGVMVEILVNGKAFPCFGGPAQADVTDWLRSERNRIVVRLIGHNRNLFGPHHHKNGESYLVGPASFEGRWAGLEEFMSPQNFHKSTWTEDYGFVPFGIEKITVSIMKKQ